MNQLEWSMLDQDTDLAPQERKSEALAVDPACSVKGINHLTPNGHYMVRTAQLTSRCCILYIYSTNIRTEYFKHAE